MNYIQISIEADELTQEVLISELSELSATGFEQRDTQLLAYFNEDDFKSYEVNDLLKGYTFQVNNIPQQNWNAVWESNFQPVTVGAFCAVRAHFHDPVKTVQHEIIITPKMSFGTGHHATTYLMMEQMQKIDFYGKTVFDFGTGTGILAILAKKLGASSITAIDVDDWSIENAKENFERNGVEEVQLYLTSLIPDETFDIVLANINKNVILQNVLQLHKALAKGGMLLVSGLLATDENDVRSAFNALNLNFLQTQQKGNWISIMFRK